MGKFLKRRVTRKLFMPHLPLFAAWNAVLIPGNTGATLGPKDTEMDPKDGGAERQKEPRTCETRG